ncbi:MAG TPA: hypothetical protein VD789_01575, partial [Thermomicrobiales bacterium]|nr:hypothetical protein [Thermomicrobiales bacterium]
HTTTPETPGTATKTPGTATEAPGTATKTPGDGGGKAEPDATVEALPSTGHGPDSGTGAGLVLALGAMSVLLFAGGVIWQRRNA